MSGSRSRASRPHDHIDALIAAHRKGYGLAREFYADPAIYERDLARVLHRHWHCLAHESVLPDCGDFELFGFGDDSIILTRADDGVIRAFLNICRHRGAEVCTERKGNARFFVCPYHAWTYGTDGVLQAARLMPPDFDRTAFGLKPLRTVIEAGLVFVSFSAEPLGFTLAARALRTSCGEYGWGEAKVAHRQTYALDANWKIAVENYVECYHCSPAHPEYSRTHALERPAERIAGMNAAMEARTRALSISIVSGDHWRNSATGEEAVDTFRYALHRGVATGSEDGRPLAPLMGRFTAFDGGATSIHLGGTTFLVCYPDHGMIYRFVPKGVDACDLELTWLVRKDAEQGRDYDLDRLTWLWSVTSKQDKRIIEHTARGVRSRFFTPGPLAPMERNELRYIDWYLQELGRA